MAADDPDGMPAAIASGWSDHLQAGDAAWANGKQPLILDEALGAVPREFDPTPSQTEPPRLAWVDRAPTGVVYAVISDPVNIFNGGYAAFYDEISSLYDNNNLKLYYANGLVKDNTNGNFDPVVSSMITADRFLMIPEWTDDKVYLFDAQTGDLLDANFIPIHFTAAAKSKRCPAAFFRKVYNCIRPVK